MRRPKRTNAQIKQDEMNDFEYRRARMTTSQLQDEASRFQAAKRQAGLLTLDDLDKLPEAEQERMFALLRQRNAGTVTHEAFAVAMQNAVAMIEN